MIDYDLIQGREEYVYFLHGWGGDKNSFACVRNCIEKKFNMVFVSFSGFGKSKEPDFPYVLDNYVDELKELIDCLSENNQISIVCHSFGARVAVRLISRYPNLVSRLVIVDGAGVKPKRSLRYYINILKYKHAKNLVNAGKLPKKELEKYGSSDYKALSDVMKRTFVNIVNENLKKDYKNVKCETLIYWGKDDKDTPVYMAKKIHSWVVNSKLYIRKGCGHFSYIEDSYHFIGLLEKFLFGLN